MKRIQIRLGAWLLALCLLMPSPALAAGTLEISSVSGKAGETVVVEVRFTSDDVYGGNFNLLYNTEHLELVCADQGSGFMGAINPNYRPGTVRVTLASGINVISDVTLCTLTLRILSDTPPEGSAVTAGNVRLYDGASQPVSCRVISGTVTRSCAWLRLDSAETVAGQAARVEVSLAGGLEPAGGNFAVTYDPAVVKPTSVLPLSGLTDASLVFDETVPGRLKVAFAGTSPVDAGPLCAVIFVAVGSADSGTALTLEDIRLFDTESNRMDHAVTNGSVNVVIPTASDPKLWVVGGALEPNGTATVSVMLQGRGSICGGQFTLLYDEAMTAAVTGGSDVVLREEAGRIHVTWSSATPDLDERIMLNVTFFGAEEGMDVTFDSNVRLYNANSEPAAVVDIRPTVITAASSVTAVVDQVSVNTSGGSSAVTVAVDLADIKHFSDDALQVIRPVLALYDSGRLIGLTMADASDIVSGILETELTVQTSRRFDACQVFVLSDASLPLCPMLQVDP